MELPGLSLQRFPGSRIDYPEDSGMVLKMAVQLPKLLRGIRQEHIFLKNLVRETGAGLVISDNRYGCWHPGVKSVFLTHQLDIQVPGYLKWSSPLLRKAIYSFISKYDECWIPDAETECGLAGCLSHPPVIPLNCYYIGTLSRFSMVADHTGPLPCNAPDIFVLLSGPEPQRSILESLIINQLKGTAYTAIIAGGRPGSREHEVIEGRITIFPHLDSSLIKFYLENAEYIVCRSGYSTLMDLASLGRSAILIPTPGQTEQEYLAGNLSAKKIHYSAAQKEFRLEDAIKESSGYKGILLRNDLKKLKERIRKLSTA